ncbi:kinase-like domain-containing protein [Rhizophagus irregularis DAOM 181602=DAOM 197198]|nr:kinase-like domain-containing protein [Rhizophagus irregularis DAOM 181602=DAOM 197198]
MINERLEPKVASFNFGGSAKQGTKVKFSSKCDIFSFIQKDFTKIIRAAWQNDPILRPRLHELFNHYTL